jgi:cytochrome P450
MVAPTGRLDLLDPSIYAAGQPWSHLRWLQENEPISWNPEPGNGPGYWVITRYADVKAIESDWKTFSNEPTAVIDDTRVLGDGNHRLLLFEDPPNHTSHRKFVGVELAPQPVKGLRERAEQIADDTIDEFVERGECDFVWDIAGNMTSYLMADVLGLSREDAIDLYDASEIMNSGASYLEGVGLDAVRRMGEHAHQVWVERRKAPGSDVLSRLANGELRGVPSDEAQFALDFLLLVTAAGDTTRNVIAGGMLALFEHPDQRAIMANGDAGVVASGVEEMLRWVAPVYNMRRTAMVDTEVAGRKIRAGEKLALYYGIANRDPAQFSDPWTFDVLRSPNAHLTFGFGTHFCLGSHLARLTLNAVFPKVFQRMSDLEPTAPARFWPPDSNSAPNVIGPKTMPVRFSPGRAVNTSYDRPHLLL